MCLMTGSSIILLTLNLKTKLGENSKVKDGKVAVEQEFQTWSKKERAGVREAGYSLVSYTGGKSE